MSPKSDWFGINHTALLDEFGRIFLHRADAIAR